MPRTTVIAKDERGRQKCTRLHIDCTSILREIH
jgi:hypothetical protein